MKKNNPETPPTIQMTPVEFSPNQTGEDIGSITPARRAGFQYPIFVPLLIIVLTLIGSTVRDITTMNRRMEIIGQQDAPAREMLKKSTKQSDFISSLRTGVLNLAPSDPVAAEIASDFFPPVSAPKPDSPDDASKTPAN